MHCFACLKFLRSRRTRKPVHRSIHPASLNDSTFNSSLQPVAPNREIMALMSQVQKSRRSSCCSFRSTVSGMTAQKRRNSAESQRHFVQIVGKRGTKERINRNAFGMYREVAGVLILGEQLRVQTRRTPPLPEPVLERQHTA